MKNACVCSSVMKKLIFTFIKINKSVLCGFEQVVWNRYNITMSLFCLLFIFRYVVNNLRISYVWTLLDTDQLDKWSKENYSFDLSTTFVSEKLMTLSLDMKNVTLFWWYSNGIKLVNSIACSYFMFTPAVIHMTPGSGSRKLQTLHTESYATIRLAHSSFTVHSLSSALSCVIHSGNVGHQLRRILLVSTRICSQIRAIKWGFYLMRRN